MSALLTADLTPLGRGFPDAEPVTLEADHNSLTLVTDDGTKLVFDRGEFEAALVRETNAGRRAA